MVKNLPPMHETWVWFLGQKHLLKKGMATHSCILAWRIPWTVEPDRLLSLGSQGVGHNWVTFTFKTTLIFKKVAHGLIGDSVPKILGWGLCPGGLQSPGQGRPLAGPSPWGGSDLLLSLRPNGSGMSHRLHESKTVGPDCPPILATWGAWGLAGPWAPGSLSEDG